MKNRKARPRFSVSLTLGVSAIVSLVAAAGCGDDTVRGAGSIDVPRPARKAFPDKAAARPGEAAGIPPAAR
jgi:hypothetical protein